jgi:hypothetical protein
MRIQNRLLRSISWTPLTALAALASAATQGLAQSEAPRARAVEPIGAISEILRSHRVVAIGNVEFRGDDQSQAFLRSLVRDARFPTAGTDIVVEFGNARYQSVIDRFIRGGDVPSGELRQVWQNTTQVEWEWDLPIYEEFFRTVRAVNGPLPPERRLRVLLADPPIDWAARPRPAQPRWRSANPRRVARGRGSVRQEVGGECAAQCDAHPTGLRAPPLR